jgi:hypothetical protein
MSRIAEVGYTVEVWCKVDLDSGEVLRVSEQVDGITATGEVNATDGEPLTESEKAEALKIAEDSDEWPAWESL